ncbi:MAG TPA: ATP-binding protein [Roseiflexaceae bacterium]|nr:ATP-binding protein [Roseiflexaceae bacterium]
MPRRSTSPASQANEPVVQPEQLVSQVRLLLAEAQALSSRLAALNEIAIGIQEHLDTEQLLQTLARHARWVIDFQICSIAWVLPHGYRIQILRGTDPQHDAARSYAGGAIGRALGGQHAQLVNQATPADILPPGMQSALIIPLKSGGRTLGTLNFYHTNPDHYTLDDIRIASALTTQAAAVLQNVQLFAEIAQARDELHTVLESIGDAVLVIDRSGNLRLANSAAVRLFALDTAELIGRPLVDLVLPATRRNLFVNPDDLGAIMAAWERDDHQGSGTVQFSDNRYFEWAIAPLQAIGKLDGAVITLRDVSDRVLLENLRDDMIQMLVHDLRTPLTSMIMSLDMLDFAQSRGDRELSEQTMKMARGASYRLLDQINLLLDLRKLEAGQLTLDLRPLPLPDLLNAAADTVRLIARGNNQTISVSHPSDVALIAADQALIRRVIENLLGNAVKFAPNGTIIELTAARVGDMIEFTVTDRGPGIPEEMRTQIFEKYVQIDGAMRRKGTGLGLTFCKLVVEQHGGTIGVDALIGGGSRFWFRLPLTAD